MARLTGGPVGAAQAIDLLAINGGVGDAQVEHRQQVHGLVGEVGVGRNAIDFHPQRLEGVAVVGQVAQLGQVDELTVVSD
jgi:hypothetical protein